MHRRAPDRAMIAGQWLSKLFQSELLHHFKELSVRPVAVVEQALQILDGHARLAFEMITHQTPGIKRLLFAW
jgi:hypothetical protein